MHIRQLRPGDEPVLAELAEHEAAFDLEGRSAPRTPLPMDQARAYLADDHLLFWVAEEGTRLLGFLSCQLIRKRAAPPELMLYEIGVRGTHRRRGIGRALVRAMDRWLEEHGLREVWVLADNPNAIAFYEACGLARAEGTATMLERNPA